ncbi:MAG TPA: cardiolipin synthase [Planctomycetota bacterium]|nr:cardiolipin synthase [Planctomycetota bacterium]HRR81158.1 cardiolipin synthase [Planctomycetota bacterium]HRT94083.1 cardiolipin synthase [Planctomycetota bacterium]
MWLWIAESIALALALAALPVVLVQRRHPTATVAWVLAIFFMPYLGLLLFFALSWRRPERVRKRYHERDDAFLRRSGSWPVIGDADEEFAHGEFRALADALERMEGFPARPGNAVEFTADGRTFRETLLSGIRSARHHVHLEFYIYQNDETGNAVTEALCAKAREGVECRLLLDAVGALWFHKSCLTRLRAAGVNVDFFHPVDPLRKRFFINYRMHRKIAVFDGVSALTGGRNVGDEYAGRRKGEREWQDLSILVRGPAVLDLQQVFLKDWYYTTGEALAPARYCPRPQAVGHEVVQVVPSEPSPLGSAAEFGHLLAIRGARQSLRIVTPYFVPPESMHSALVTAALSGVNVEIVVPVVSDSPPSLWAGRSTYRELIEAGVRIWEFQDGMLHGKLMIVDDHWCAAGSANMDCRSFRLSFEVSCFVYSRQDIPQLLSLFEQYRGRSRPIEDPLAYERRLRDRLRCSVARLASPLL